MHVLHNIRIRGLGRGPRALFKKEYSTIYTLPYPTYPSLSYCPTIYLSYPAWGLESGLERDSDRGPTMLKLTWLGHPTSRGDPAQVTKWRAGRCRAHSWLEACMPAYVVWVRPKFYHVPRASLSIKAQFS